MAAQKKQLSLDTNFVFDLAGDKDFAHDFREISRRKGYALVLPPTAAHELHFIFTHGGSAAERELARTALKEQLREHHSGEERAKTDAEQAERIVRAGLKRLDWREADLAARAKGDREKLKLAVRLRAETSVTVKWIATRLRMGTWTHLNHLLYWQRREKTR